MKVRYSNRLAAAIVVAINTPQVPGGLGWTKELAVKRREYLTSSAHIKGKAAPQHRAARLGRT